MSTMIAPELTLPKPMVARLVAERREIARLQKLYDPWLSRELLRLARQIRMKVHDFRTRESAAGYTGMLLWDYVPELARRLGAKVEPDEANDKSFNAMQGEKLRTVVASAMGHINHARLKAYEFEGRFRPDDILFSDYRNGNPIVFALDRVATPALEFNDKFSVGIRKLAVERGFEPQEFWHPSFLEALAGEDEDEEENFSAPIVMMSR